MPTAESWMPLKVFRVRGVHKSDRGYTCGFLTFVEEVTNPDSSKAYVHQCGTCREFVTLNEKYPRIDYEENPDREYS